MHDYTGKLGVIFTKILTPEYLSERMTDREIHETVRIAKKFLSLHSPGCSAFYCGWKRYRIFYFWHYCSYIGIYLGFKREFSKLIGFLVVALVAVGLACIQYVRRKRRIVTVIQ